MFALFARSPIHMAITGDYLQLYAFRVVESTVKRLESAANALKVFARDSRHRGNHPDRRTMTKWRMTQHAGRVRTDSSNCFGSCCKSRCKNTAKGAMKKVGSTSCCKRKRTVPYDSERNQRDVLEPHHDIDSSQSFGSTENSVAFKIGRKEILG